MQGPGVGVCKEADVPGGKCTRVAGGDGDREEVCYQGSGPNPESQGGLRSDLQLKVHYLGWEAEQKLGALLGGLCT